MDNRLEDEDIKFLIHLVIIDHDLGEWEFFSVNTNGRIWFRAQSPFRSQNAYLDINKMRFGDFYFPCGSIATVRLIDETMDLINKKFPELERLALEGFIVDHDLLNAIKGGLEL